MNWMPCDVELPIPSKRYLVTVDWGFDGGVVCIALYGTNGRWYGSDNKPLTGKVLAWIRLPKPYKKA